MQGTKIYQEKIFISFRLSEHIPLDNFYRRLKKTLDLSSLSSITKQYYGSEGQKSIDPEVFFKLMLIGYLEGINSDRKIIEQASMRMDMLYFLGYDIDEPLPWHSTLSRTRKLFGSEVFLELFRNILRMCVEKGMVSGHRQAVDSAFIKANASMDSLVERELFEKSRQFLTQIIENEEDIPKRESEEKNPGKHSSHFASTTDPDARVSQKRGKLPALNHLGIISVDTENHVICGAMADFADKKDSETVADIIGQTIENLQDTELTVEEVLADTGYSSGESYKFLEENNITGWIPPHGGYTPEKDGFIYNEQEDCYVCSQEVKLPFKGVKKEKNRKTSTKVYRSATADCRNCPFREKCCKKTNYKQVSHTIDKPYYDRALNLLNTRKGKQKMRLRAATVEPVWGTLLHFRGLKKVYTKGNGLANKQVLMASAAYNLKKLMYFKSIKSAATALINSVVYLKYSVSIEIAIAYDCVWFILKFITSRYRNMLIYYRR